MKMIFKTLLVISLFSTQLCASSLSRKLNAIVSAKKVASVTFGVMVANADNHEILFRHNSKSPLTPASNMKILSTASALFYLGSDYTFETKVYAQNGDLIVIGSGDPLLGDKITDKRYSREEGWMLKKIAASLQTSGIKKLGNIYVDSSVFDDQRVHPSWPTKQLNRYYACQVSGLNYNGNCIEVGARTQNNKVVTWLNPNTNYVHLINKAKPNTKKKNTIWCARPQNSNKITLFGKCYRSSVPVKVTIDRPASYFGVVLAEYLMRNGIEIGGSVIEQYMADSLETSPLLTISTSLSDVMLRCNQDSFGLAAEALVKSVSAHFTQENINGQWQHGNKMQAKYLESLGIDACEYLLDDGSGLSAVNKLSANAITRILQNIYDSNSKELFINTLAIGGVKGSSPVRSYFKQEKYKGKIFAKSGTINGVKALSGFVRTENGNYIFSIIANKANGSSRGAINDIVQAIIDCESPN